MKKHIKAEDLTGKIIDIHTHAGIYIKAYACCEYPYAATVEGSYYRQKANGIDVSVVFPFGADLFFDQNEMVKGNYIPAKKPLSGCPYAIENEMVLREVFEFCPELKEHFLPFISIDPAREVKAQLRKLEELDEMFPIYGIKINPVLCQSKITELLDGGKGFMDLAREKNWPLLIHTTPEANEEYSRAELVFGVIQKNPDLRFCLAHCIGFDKDYLRRADEMANVWVDTSALKIQVETFAEITPASRRIDGDFSDHRKIMVSLMEQFGDMIIWGSDTPAYSYICRRKQAEGVFAQFNLKASYEDEVAALNALPDDLRIKAGSINSIDFIFGK